MMDYEGSKIIIVLLTMVLLSMWNENMQTLIFGFSLERLEAQDKCLFIFRKEG